MRYLPIICLALALTTVASAGLPTHPGQAKVVALSFRTSFTPKTIRSTRLIPASLVKGVAIQAGASFNGHPAQSCWADTVQQFECAWRGVIVIVQLHKHAAPAIVRVASTRTQPVRVRISLTW
jgi:hypothetical protein